MNFTRHPRRTALAVLAVLLCLGVAVVAVFSSSGRRDVVATSNPTVPVAEATKKPTTPPAAQPKPKSACRTSGGAFVPTAADIGGVGVVNVFAAARPPGQAAGTPPETNVGKRMMAWDAPGLKPNASDHGAVVTDAHSWPDSSALGNTMMGKLALGATVELQGQGSTACYKIVSKTVYDALHLPLSTFSSDGPARLTITICYWPRLGPGNWQNRMVWVGLRV